MEYFPFRWTKIWILNRLYRYAMAVYPAYAFRRYGVPGSESLERLGSDYGGWYVPTSDIGQDSVVYSAGIGQDISFDEALIANRGCAVYGFDPTPSTIDFIARRRQEKSLTELFRFQPFGLWDTDQQLLFFAPKTRGWIGSYSAQNLQGTAESISASVKQLSTLMRENNHNHIDLLKMDIEGAEYRVINEIIEKEIPIRWLCIEFDQPVPFWTTNRALQRLNDAGYKLRKVDRWNFVFRNISFSTTTTTE